MAGAVVALAAVAWLAPSVASAGCATRHYVVSGSGQAFDGLGLERLDLVPDSAAPALPVPPSSPSRPCSGPTCSGNATPPLMPAAPVVLRVEPWGCLTEPSPQRDESDPGTRLPEEPSARPVRRGPTVDRPPRLLTLPCA